MENKEQQEAGTIRKILKNEVTSLVAIIVTIFSFIMFIVTPQQKSATNIALIQQSVEKIEKNHLTHLQNYAEEIKTLKEHEVDIERQINDQQKANIEQLTKIQTLIELHLAEDKK